MCYDRISRWRILLFSLRVFLAYRQEAVMGIQNKITSLIFMAVSLIYLLPSPALAQNLDSNAVVAADAYTFAKDIAEVNQNDPVFKALENAHNKQFGKGNKADEEIKTGSYIQCGNKPCDLDTHVCWQMSNGSGPGGISYSYSCKLKGEEAPRGIYGMAATPCTQDCEKLFISTVSALGGPSVGDVKGAMTMTGADGKTYQVSISSTISVQYANASNDATRGCEVLPVKLYNYRKCFFCPLVGVIYDGSAKITDVAFSKMAAAFATLLAVGFAIWVALQVLTQVSSLTKQDAPKFLAAIIKQSYKVIIAFILLQNSQQVFEYAVRPILEAGLVFGQNMLTTQDIFKGLDYDETGKYIRQAKEVTGGIHYRLDTYDKLEQYVVAVQRQIAFMQAVGTSLICTGSNLMLFHGKIKEFGDGFQMFVQGAVLAIFGFLLSLAFGFYLIDAIVQFGVVGALLPFLIAAWPFKATAKYTSTGTQMLLNSAFLFLFVGLVISANVHLINEALNVTADEKQNELLSLCGQQSYYLKNKETCDDVLEKTPRMGALYEIAQTLNSSDSTKLKELTDISAMGFLILLFCCFFGFKFTNQAVPLADKFASGSIGKPIAPSIATMGASFTKSAALKATENVREAAGDRLERGVKWAVGLAPRGVKSAWRTIRGKNKSPANSSGSAPQTSGSRVANTPEAGEAQGGRTAATLSEKSQKPQNNQTPTLNEKEAKTAPTLNEASTAQASVGKHNHNPETVSSDDEEMENMSSTDQIGENEDNNEPETETYTPEQRDAQRNLDAHRTREQAAANQGASGRNYSPRRPTPQNSQTVSQGRKKSRGGSKSNRKKQLRRKK